MNIKIVPCVLSLLSIFPAQSSAYQDDIYKVNSSIWIRNLDVRRISDDTDFVKEVYFEINFHSSSLSGKLQAKNPKVTANDYPSVYFEPDWRQGYQFQPVHLKMDSYFVEKIGNNEYLEILYGDQLLFKFKCPARLICVNEYRYDSLSALPEDLIFINKVRYPHIENGQIVDYHTELFDLSKIDFEKIKTYYYGKFPDEYLWFKFESDFYDGVSGTELIKNYEEYKTLCMVYFKEKILFKNYHRPLTNLNDIAYQFSDYFRPNKQIGDYFNFDYCNELTRVTFKDGRMRIKSELSDYELKETHKNSSFITFPLDEDLFDYNYNLAKNMTVTLSVQGGKNKNFSFSVTFQLDLQKDFFYNHLHEISIKSEHDVGQLDTVDTIYA